VDERTKNKTIFLRRRGTIVFFIVSDVSLGQIVKSGFISIFCRQTYLALIVDVHTYIPIYILYVYLIHARSGDFPSTPNVAERRKVFIMFLFP